MSFLQIINQQLITQRFFINKQQILTSKKINDIFAKEMAEAITWSATLWYLKVQYIKKKKS